VGKKKSKNTTTNEPPKWAVPHLQGAMGTISNTVNANQPNLDAMSQQLQGYLPQLGQMAFGQNAGLNAANGYATDVLGGKYLSEGNPHMQGMIDQTAGDVTDRVNSMFSKAGASMGSPHAQVLTKELANAENSLRYGNYSQERQMQGQAAGMIPGLTQAQYAGIMPYLAMTQGAAQLPYTGIQNLGQIGGLLGGAGSQTQTQPGGWGSGLLGAAAMALPFIPGFGTSARAAKTKIEEIGLWDSKGDGLKKYRFAYKWSPDEMMEGVMAEEVAELRPHALGPIDHRGFQTVNYGAL
jgi:hypothetical protein